MKTSRCSSRQLHLPICPGSAIIRDAVSRMRPETQRLLTTEDGKILGLPNAHMLRPLYWDQEAWDVAGLTTEAVPQSFTQLLDFLDVWIERTEASSKKNVCVIAFPDNSAIDESDRDAAWLVSLLLTTWETQKRYTGDDITFNTSEFIALANRAREVGQKLYQSEPPLKKRPKLLQLFCDETIEPGDYAFGGRDYGLSHTIPLRITADQPALLRADAVIQCIHANSKWLDTAKAFIEDEMNAVHWTLRYSMDMDFLPGKYDGGSVSAGWMADLVAYDGTIVYLVNGYDAQKEQYESLFVKGEITAQQLAEGLDKPLVQREN